MIYIDIQPYGVIYKLTNNINNKIYIGKTTKFNRRMSEYRNRKVSDSKRYNYGIIREINDVGFENFSTEIIAYGFSASELSALEKFYITTLNATNPDIGYNSRLGDLREPLNDATRQRMSKTHTGLKETAITKRKKSKKVIAFKDNMCYIADSGKLFGDFINKCKGAISHAVIKHQVCDGYYIFRYGDQTQHETYMNLRNTKFIELYKLVIEGVETIEKTYNIVYIKYE